MILLADAAATAALGERIAATVRPGDVITLSGELGAGKTTLARGMLRGLGWTRDVPSPTFTLVERYDCPPLRIPVWHVDLFRIENPGEVRALGLEEAEAGLLLVEWPERARAAGEPEPLALTLQPTQDGARALTAVVPRAWAGRWPPPS